MNRFDASTTTVEDVKDKVCKIEETQGLGKSCYSNDSEDDATGCELDHDHGHLDHDHASTRIPHKPKCCKTSESEDNLIPCPILGEGTAKGCM